MSFIDGNNELRLKLALAGIGKIAREQHEPVIASRKDVDLIATISRNAEIDGVPAYRVISDAIQSQPEIEALIICTPPRFHFEQAREAIFAGWHVFLEKPPTSSLSQLHSLQRLARSAGVTLFTSWHSRCAPAVEPARQWLFGKTLKSVQINWKEDVRKWHPGQDWIFEPGGMGVFDPGINALSIATRILPLPFALRNATLTVPANCHAPIAASLTFSDEAGIPINAEFDFREEGAEIWEILVQTEEGELTLSSGGDKLEVNRRLLDVGSSAEYSLLYDRFTELVRTGESDVDVTPLAHIADAFMLGELLGTDDFNW